MGKARSSRKPKGSQLVLLGVKEGTVTVLDSLNGDQKTLELLEHAVPGEAVEQ